MRHIKTYEGLIQQMNIELKSIRKKYEAEVAECLFLLEDEHGLKIKQIKDDSFEYTVTDLNLEPTEELKRDFKLIKKKLLSLGLIMEVTFKLHSSLTAKVSVLRANMIDLEHNIIRQNIEGITITIYDIEDID